MPDKSADTDDKTARDTSLDNDPVGRVNFEVLPWVRRVGTNSWMFVGMAVALALVILAIAATRDITAPLAVGTFVAIVCAPIVTWLQDHGLKRAAGAGIVLVGLVVVFAGCALITAEALGSQSEALSENLSKAVDEVKTWAADLPIGADAVDEVDSTAQDAAPVARDGVATALATAANSAAGFITGLVLGTIVLYYVLKDGPTMVNNWLDRRPDPARRAAAQRIVEKSIKDVQSYFTGQTALALVNGVSIAIGMYFLGVPGALAIGVVNFVGAYIPYIGAFIGGAFAVLMALGDGGVGMAVAAFAVVIVAQLVLENMLQPKLLGSSLNLSPLTILLATTFGGMVAGMIGLILAAPVAAIGHDLSRELRAIGYFGAGDEPEASSGPQPTPEDSRAPSPSD